MDKSNSKIDPKILARLQSLLYGLSAFGVVTVAVQVLAYLQVRQWQALLPIGVTALALLLVVPIYLLARTGKKELATTILMFGSAVTFSATEASWSGLAWYNIIGSLVLLVLIGSILAPKQYNRYFVISLPYLILVLFANRLNPIARFPEIEAPILRLFLLGLDIFLGILLLTQVVFGSRLTSIRARLVVAFALLVILPLIAVSIVSSYMTTQNQQIRTHDQIDAIVSMKYDEVYRLIEDTQTYLGYVLSNTDNTGEWSTVLESGDTKSPEYQSAYNSVRSTLNTTLLDTKVFEELAVIDINGTIRVSTYNMREWSNVSGSGYFEEGLNSFYLSPPIVLLGNWSIVATMPIRDANSDVIGVLMGSLIMNELNQMMMMTPGLGSTGNIYMVQVYGQDNYRLITPLSIEPYNAQGVSIPSSKMSWIIEGSQAEFNIHENLWDEPSLGAFRWVAPLEMYLVAEQTQAESQVITRNSILLNAIIGGISLIIAVVAGLVVTRQMTLPLVRLGKTAEQIAAGDFNLRVPGEGTDEIGSLALALDKMTRQLRSLISGLEERVAERTAEVERRSSQLQVASMVARDATSIHDLDSLMNRAVEMIVERFDFYHAGIFLVDELGEYAVLRAAPGDAGRRMLDVGHKLRVGEEGIVGHVSSTGQARIALDVGEDAVHFRNPMLPQTRSEMGLPLRVAERVIGVLDVQSTHGAAFDQEDVDTLQTMADQLSVAIENARLFNSMSDALSQLQVAQQEYTQESWKRFTQDPQRTRGYRYRGIGVETYDHELPTVEGEHILQVPLKIREQLVGNIRLKLNNPAMESEIISTVEEISSRLSIVLESARLLEETQLRSEQIRLLQEVTSAASMNIEMNALLNEVIQKIAGGFNFDHCSILMFDPDLVNGTLIASKNAQGEDTHVVGMRVPVSSSPLMVDLVNHQKSLAVYNAVNDPKAYSIKEILSQFDANTLILTPIIVRSEIQGVILLTSTDITRRMSDEDLRLLDQIGLQVAVGVDVAQLFELTEKRAQREQVINEIANRMRESLEIDIVLQTAAREMRKALNLDDVTIQLAVSNENRSN